MDDTEIAIVVCGVVWGLMFLHANGVLHRDVKPVNILLDEVGYPQIGDLSTSRLMDLNITQTVGVGTPMYMAPEMYEDYEYTTAVGMFSFGMILYEVVVRRSVFSPTLSRLVLLKKIKANDERAEMPTSMNGTIRQIIKSCWARDPDDRLAADEVNALFERMEYKLTPQVDVGRVRAFVASIS
jgi:serine/threonine protein kinase